MAPTESSVYSQPDDSYEPSSRRGRPPIASSIYDDISPPDSPKGYEAKDSGDVSPLERDLEADIHPAFRIHNKPSYSNLPIRKPAAGDMRKPSAGDMRKPSAGDIRSPSAGDKDAPSRAYRRDPSQPLRWDKYSGEPTTSGKGIPSGVKPTSVVEVLEKKKQLKKTAETARVEEPILVDIRPPWKGASGRTTLVEPVADKPRERVPVPRRELNRPSVGPPISSSPPPDALHGSETRPTARVQSNREAAASSSTIHKVNQERPTTPDILGGWVDEQPTPKATPTRGRPPPGQDSRFSWTTQATNTTYQHSEPPSPPPPLPALSAHSIMNRSRPVPSRNYSPGPDSPVISAPPTTLRKPLSSEHARPARISSRVPPGGLASPASIVSPTGSAGGGGGKALPPVPGAVNAADHVATLQARLDDLATQRGNVERVLRDLTDPAACNPLVSNFRVEREREKRVAALRDELNDIGLMEHEVGLRMHRAQRRKEREEGYEGFTTLWVRRVTE
jgi:hypothetical protein